MVAPVLAAGTTAGTGISNTATGTYEDQNNPGTTINTTSNTVTITVAEVAGITVSASGVSNQAGGSAAVTAGSQLYYTYTVTNTGNDPTQFRIPNLATVTGPATVSGAVQTDSATAGSFVNISGSEQIVGPIAPGGSIQVRVPITINSNATSGQTVKVELGKTPNGNDQNIARAIADGGDVYTVDNPDGTATEVAGAPVNGTREASNNQSASIGGGITPQAFATVLKTRANPNTGADPAILTDDVITYGLGLRVESTAPAGSTLTPSDLLATAITVDNATVNKVLVSDAIPAGTQLAAAPTPPAGWQVVYSTDDPATTNRAANDPAVQWTTTAPALSSVKRIGFITNGPIAKGSNVTGFTFAVNPTTNSTITIASIAQVFGQTTAGPISATNPLVYDESGDQNPSNYNDDGTPGSNTPTNGVANPSTQGTDTGNNNTGTGPAGEDNVFSINGPSSGGVLSGPNGAPGATGPSGGNNDDFTNKSVVIPPGIAPGAPVNPAGVSFTNSVQNTGTTPANISLLPTAPATPGDLPTGTLVTISKDSNSATYTYNGTVFTFTSGTGVGANGQPITGTNPVGISGVAANGTDTYGVSVDLPDSAQFTGYPVSITSFADTVTANGLPDTTEAQNITIDRVYTGFLKLVKKSRVLQGTGPAVGAGQGDFESTPAAVAGINDPNPNVADVNRVPAPGNIIEYRIEYTNISTTGGNGSLLLNATRVVITEDGTGPVEAPGNNWAKDNDGNGVIDTSNVTTKAVDNNGGAISYFSGSPATTPAADQTGTSQNTDVTKYIDTVPGAIAPSVTKTFTFQRLVN